MPYPPTIATEPELVAWWRLGEPGPYPTGATSTSNFCLDSSGNNSHLAARNDATRHLGGVWFTDPTVDGFPQMGQSGAPGVDDGSIRFTLTNYEWIVWDYFLCLQAGVDLNEAWLESGGHVGDGVTVMFWTCFVPLSDPKASTGLSPFSPPYGYYPFLFGDWQHTFGVSSYGTRCGYNLETGSFGYFLQNSNISASYAWTSPVWAAYDWHHIAMTLGKTAEGPNQYRRRFYLDGTLDTEVTGSSSAVSVSIAGNNLTLGGAWSDDIRFGHSLGGLDEFSVWRRELSSTELTDFIAPPIPGPGVYLTPWVMN